jgi:hypothetical protein
VDRGTLIVETEGYDSREFDAPFRARTLDGRLQLASSAGWKDSLALKQTSTMTLVTRSPENTVGLVFGCVLGAAVLGVALYGLSTTVNLRPNFLHFDFSGLGGD